MFKKDNELIKDLEKLKDNPKVFIKTFGCRSNLYDTQVMISNLEDFILGSSEDESDFIIINSCTVTNKADKEARSYARKFSNLGKKVIFTGCGVKHQGKELFKNNLAFSVFEHSHKENINSILKNCNDGTRQILHKPVSNKHIDSTVLSKIVGKLRAFIKIQEGCNFACSYCIIPSVRGSARSFTKNHILNQVQTLVKSGVTEVILTGTNIGSFNDNGSEIADLIWEIADFKNIKRIRLGSLEPSQINLKFLESLKCEKMEKHLHIAIQHTNEEMLKIMNRKNNFKNDLILFNEISSLGFCIGTDYIIGHPEESDKIFENAFENLSLMPLTHIHPFIYSKRTGTKSANMGNEIRGDEAKIRLKKISKLIESKNICFRKDLMKSKKSLNVLIESKKTINDEEFFIGLDEYFNHVRIKENINSNINLIGKWIKINSFEVGENFNLAKDFV